MLIFVYVTNQKDPLKERTLKPNRNTYQFQENQQVILCLRVRDFSV